VTLYWQILDKHTIIDIFYLKQTSHWNRLLIVTDFSLKQTSHCNRLLIETDFSLHLTSQVLPSMWDFSKKFILTTQSITKSNYLLTVLKSHLQKLIVNKCIFHLYILYPCLIFFQLSNNPKPREMLNPVFLNNILTKSLRSSMHADDVYADNLSFAIKYAPDVLQQTGNWCNPG
jgi:hypothetical protein